MNIGFFGIQSSFRGGQQDRPYLPRLGEIIGPHATKVALTEDGVEYFNQFAAKAKAANLDAAICTDQKLLTLILKALPDFKIAYNKNGSEKKLTLNDYHGSLITVPAAKLGRDRDIDILILNPLEHLRTVAEAPFIYKRFVSKITNPNKWFPQTSFTWEVATESTIEFLFERFKSARLISCDIETLEGDPDRRISCSGYCALFPDGSSHAVVIPTVSMWGVMWMRKFNSLPVPKVFQNGLYDNLYFLRYGSPPSNWLYDTQHLFHSWYSELPKRLDFITVFALRSVRFWKDDGKSGGLHAHYEYNARDCWATLNSCLSLVSEMPEWAVKNYLQEFPLVFPCLHCEADGLSLDKAAFEKSKRQVESELAPMEARLAKWISPKFNPGSSQQVQKLMGALGCGDKHGKVESSGEKALVAAASLHPLNELIFTEILAARKKRKLLTTYLVWDKFWNDRLYYKLNPAGTDTGRLASTESSFWCGLQIQNMPRGDEVKSFIVADEGWDGIAEGDYAQSEARCVGYLSGCTSLIDLVEGPHDYHSWNASAFFGVPYESIYDEAKGKTLDKPLRDLSKRTNHGANYNMGAQVMLETMGPKKVAEARKILKLPPNMPLLNVCAHLLAQYERTYPEVKKDFQEWIKRTIAITKKMVSPLGWTRHFFADPRSSKPALNAAVAHGPQNLSVGIINQTFYKIWHKSVYGELRGLVRLKAQIHDSILFCYKGEQTPEAVRQLMINPVPVTDIKGVTRMLKIPPDMSSGAKSWAGLK